MVVAGDELGLPWLAPWLNAALRTQRAHAVLLHGSQDVGQWPLALTLAQAWLCETGAGERPCGTCASCRLVQAHSHPDLLVVLPEVLQGPLGWGEADDDDSVAYKAGKTKLPSKEIKVDAVRMAVAFAQTTSARGRAKVVLIHPAERMNGVAANALLKTLEEPPGNARFVLCSSAPDALLATIRSRCQAFVLQLPPVDQATAWLSERGIASPEVMLAAAGGQPLDALAWVEQGVDAASWARIPQRVALGDASPFTGWPMPRLVDALQKVCHDALSVCVGGTPRYFAQDAVPAEAALAALLHWSRELSHAARHADHPFNAPLTIEAMIGQGRRALAPAQRQRDGARGVSVHSRA